MEQNPSFNQGYAYEGGGEGGAYHDTGTSHRPPRRGKTRVATGGEPLSNFGQREHFDSKRMNTAHTHTHMYIIIGEKLKVIHVRVNVWG